MQILIAKLFPWLVIEYISFKFRNEMEAALCLTSWYIMYYVRKFCGHFGK